MRSIHAISLLTFALLLSSCKKDALPDKNLSCLPANLTNSVIAFYPFSNGTLNDFSGLNNHLNNSTPASPVPDRNGNAACAFTFNNTTAIEEYLTTGNTAFLNNLAEFSIALWYQPLNAARQPADFESLVNRSLGIRCPDRNGEWSIALYDCGRTVFGGSNSVWDAMAANFDCQQEINTRANVWAHTVVSYRKSDGAMSIYRNGTLQDSKLGNTNCTSGVATFQDAGDLFVGKNFTGSIDDIIIFNKMLSPQEVNALYAMDTCCEN
jgi:hypothetical protein